MPSLKDNRIEDIRVFGKKVCDPMPRLVLPPLTDHPHIPTRKNVAVSFEFFPPNVQGERIGEWVERQVRLARTTLQVCVDVDEGKCGGFPTLKGTRITLSQVLSQVADGDSIDDLVEDFELDRDTLSSLFHALSACLRSPFRR